MKRGDRATEKQGERLDEGIKGGGVMTQISELELQATFKDYEGGTQMLKALGKHYDKADDVTSGDAREGLTGDITNICQEPINDITNICQEPINDITTSMADNLVTGPATSKQTLERNSPADGRYGTGLEVARASLYDGAESVDKDQLLQHLLDGTPLVSMSTASSCNAERVDDERVCDSEKRLGYATGYTPREPSKGKSTADNGVGCDGGPGKIETIDPGGESERCEGTRCTHTNVGRKDNTFMETDTSTSHNTVTYLMKFTFNILGGAHDDS
jgi:hypothetical protein